MIHPAAAPTEEQRSTSTSEKRPISLRRTHTQPPKTLPAILSRLVPALILGLFFYVGYAVLTTRHTPEPPLKSLTNWQESDAPQGIPIDSGKPSKIQQFNPQFHLHSAFEHALIPTAPRFDHPMGSANAALTYNAQPFWEMNKARGGNHTGDDINGIGGQNSDLGDPVHAIGNGLVVYSGTPSPGWGKTVILAHRTPKNEIIHSMYAHLNAIHIAYMDHVPRGEIIGTVGTAGGNYLAHLHLEMRRTDGISPQAGYTSFKFDRLNPEDTIQTHRNAKPQDLNPSPLAIMQANQRNQQKLPSMDAKSALELQKFLNKDK